MPFRRNRFRRVWTSCPGLRFMHCLTTITPSPMYRLAMSRANKQEIRDRRMICGAFPWMERLRDDVRKRNQIPSRLITDVDFQLGRALESYRAQVDGVANQPPEK